MRLDVLYSKLMQEEYDLKGMQRRFFIGFKKEWTLKVTDLLRMSGYDSHVRRTNFPRCQRGQSHHRYYDGIGLYSVGYSVEFHVDFMPVGLKRIIIADVIGCSRIKTFLSTNKASLKLNSIYPEDIKQDQI